MKKASFIVLQLFCLIILPFSIKAATSTVTNTNDSGAGSLRRAILDANTNLGTDTIVFNIGSGIQMIRPTSELPIITDPIIIDGSTQPGFSGTPLIIIDGTSITRFSPGLRISAGNSILRSIAINNFRDGIALVIDTNDGNTIQGCYIGVDPDGITLRRNSGGISVASSNNLIGGRTASERNVISGSSSDNLSISQSASNNQIQGNFIGTNAAGTAKLSDGSGNGISILSLTNSGNIVGGTEPGMGNLISGNGQAGVYVGGQDTIVQGNLIGTDITGKLRIPNATFGVYATGKTILIGGTTVAARNIISGNNFQGIRISTFFNPLSPPRIQGNYIGVDITGKSAVPNAFIGIDVYSQAIIGGTEPGAGNIISGNFTGGIILNNNLGSTVQGNLIGTDVTGTVALGNGNNGVAIDIRSSNNLIGGTTAAARNVVSGNNTAIDIGGGTTERLTGNIIQGNYIGTDISGTNALPNKGAQAVSITGSNNLIGGAIEGAGNIIAYNNGIGVRIVGTFSVNTENAIRRNSFFSNGGLAIDLGTGGITPNDANDSDAGANTLQNFPVITSAVISGNSIKVQGLLNSTANTAFAIEFFDNAACDPSGNGEGQIFIGSTSITTDASGNASFDIAFPITVANNRFITSTATDPAGNTSEFSACRQIFSSTAANVTIGGRVIGYNGRGIFRAFVTITDVAGVTRTVLTNAFGYYRFADVQIGGTYNFSVLSKNGKYSPQVITINEELMELNFIAEP
ncbi:MAG TPA: carboxypeptidase-like regulatory domain-containing protein [Pyrinomonadaceae bacterium]|jgi:titin